MFGRIYLAAIVMFAVGSGSVWAQDSTRRMWPRLNGVEPVLDTSKIVAVPGDSVRLYRTEARLRFKEGVPDSAKAAVFARRKLSVLGVDPTDAFYVRFEDPGPTLADLRRYLKSLRSEPTLDVVAPMFRDPLPESNVGIDSVPKAKKKAKK